MESVYEGAVLPRPFDLLRGALEVAGGSDPKETAARLRTTAKRLVAIASSTDPLTQALGASLADSGELSRLKRARAGLGQMLLGQAAERAFEDIYRVRMGTSALALDDDRSSRTDTDYRVLNGERKPVFRCNIKFHGTLFRNARDLVGLDPEDCFALATYKIHAAIRKQEEEHLPFLFMIISVPGVTREYAGDIVPEDIVHLMALVQAGSVGGRRTVEDSLVSHLLQQSGKLGVGEEVEGMLRQLKEAEWRVISARKADELLRKLLFERVYAVRVRGFASNYPNAELDMHFSISDDLTPLAEFLALLKDRGLHGATSYVERGTI